jgi:hypothetical protein
MIFALVLTSAWLLVVAKSTAQYLGIVLSEAVLAVFRLIAAEETGRALFVSTSGYVAPVWERVIGLGSIAIIVVVLPFGLWAIWRQYRQNSLVLVMSAMALTYLGMLGLRLVPAAWETSNRSAEFLYVGLSLVIAAGVTEIWTLTQAAKIGPIIVTIGLTWMFFGGIVAGWPENLRLARIDQVRVGDQILVSQEAAASSWMLGHVGPGKIVAADDSNSRLLLTTANEQALTGYAYNIDNVLGAPTFQANQIQILRKFQVEYALVDRRRISGDNMLGYFFVPKKPVAGWDVGLFDLDRLIKFDLAPGAERIFDSGDIAIYDVKALWDGSATH